MELSYEGKMVGISKRTLEALWDAQNFLRPSFCGSHRTEGMGVSKLPRRRQRSLLEGSYPMLVTTVVSRPSVLSSLWAIVYNI